MTIRELEDDLNSYPPMAVGHQDLSKWTPEECRDYKDWLWEQYEEFHRYDNISEEAAWDLA